MSSAVAERVWCLVDLVVAQNVKAKKPNDSAERTSNASDRINAKQHGKEQRLLLSAASSECLDSE